MAVGRSESIGKLFRVDDVKVVEWEIPDFSTLSDRVGTFYDSPVFVFSDTCWNLRICPNGMSQWHDSEGYVSLFVGLLESCADPVDVTLSFKNAEGKDSYAGSFTKTFGKPSCNGYGFPRFCERSTMMSRGSYLRPEDVLTVRCTLQHPNRCPVRVSLLHKYLHVTRNMVTILKCKNESEVVFKLHGLEFKAHKVVLMGESKVFEAMFTHDMVENRKREVSIDDVEADVFQQVLNYIYFRQVENLGADNVFGLYKAADKYDLEGLRVLCSTFMVENMSTDLFCDVLALADTHNETELMTVSKDFFNKNTIRILESEKWKKLLAENSVVAATLLTSIMKENTYKKYVRNIKIG